MTWTQLSVGALFAAAIAATSCANSEAETRSNQLAQTIHDQQVEHFVRTFSVRAPARAVALAEARAHAPSIRTLVEQGRLDFEDDASVRELVTLLFAERDYEHLFVYGTRLTPDGRAVLDTVRQAPRQGLDPSALHGPLADDLAADLAAAGDLDPIIARLQLSAEDEAALLAFMLHHSGVDGTLPAHDAVFAAVADSEGQSPLPDVAGAVTELTARLARAAEAGPRLELVLAAAFVRYAIANRHGNLGYVDDEVAEGRGWDVDDDAQRQEIVRALVGDSFRRATESGFATVLPQLRPPFQQYDRLVDGLAEYAAYVAAGGWETVPVERSLRAGDSGAAVLALRRRLAAENYFDGPLDEPLFDTVLEDAVRTYQRSHQLTPDGVISGATLYSVNVPAERRLAQIHAALDFWRGSRRAHDAARTHIWVNVPDFHAELWNGPELVYRWRVVVGRDTGEVTPEGEPRGQTPLFSDRMEYLVFNPYWNVPDPIREQEYDPQILADPYWLIDNGFEIVQEGDREWLRQLPGPNNALGRVKFLFPNPHDVYMHDTPHRSLFARATRAFSHGCVRVEDPMELAHLLLRRDRGWSDHHTERYITERVLLKTEQWVTLLHPIPIHIEYVSVRGGDDGRVEFLADPYRLDRPLVEAWEARLAANAAAD